MASNRFGEELGQSGANAAEAEEHPRSGLAVNAAYLLLILSAAYLISQAVGIVFFWIFKPDTIEATRGDLSLNYYLRYPLRGILMLGAFYLVLYLGASRLGFTLAYKYKMAMPEKKRRLQAVVALAVYELLCVYFYYDAFINPVDFGLPSWYVSGFFGALFRLFNASNVFESALEGTVTILGLWSSYWWLQVIFEAVFCVGSYYVLRKGRRDGENQAFEARRKLLEELQQSR